MKSKFHNIFKEILQDILKYKLAIVLVCIYLIAMQLLFSTWCPIQAIFHVKCPGCGLTHATYYLVTGQWKNAFDANYTIFLWWPFLILCFIHRYVHPFKRNIIVPSLVFVCIVTIMRYILLFLNY